MGGKTRYIADSTTLAALLQNKLHVCVARFLTYLNTEMVKSYTTDLPAVRSSECIHRNEDETWVTVSYKSLYHDFVIPSLKLVNLFAEIQKRSQAFGYITSF